VQSTKIFVVRDIIFPEVQRTGILAISYIKVGCTSGLVNCSFFYKDFAALLLPKTSKTALP